jgi:shikimate kinase
VNIILFGFKSSGKTFFGKKLSQKMNCPFLDTDDLMVERYAADHHQIRSIRQMYQCLGEQAFRRYEDETIQALRPAVQSIIAVGGGAVLNPQNTALLQKLGRLIYLAAGFDTIQQKTFNSELPLFIDALNPLASLKKIYLERTTVYESIQAIRVDIDLLDETKVIEVIHGI